MTPEKMFPLMPNRSRDAALGPLSIPWSVAEKAYGVYASWYGRGQTLQRLAERGGFGISEMDDMYPAWREEVDEITRLKADLKECRELLRDSLCSFQVPLDRWHAHQDAKRKQIAALSLPCLSVPAKEQS